MEETKKNTHGGARAGAGRKKTSGGTWSFTMTPKTAEILKGVKEKSKLINDAIAFYIENYKE